jgi:hypothetical protein
MIDFRKNDQVINIPNAAFSLDSYLDKSETDYINAKDLLDYVPYSIVNNTLANFVSKLRHGGKILIGGTNINYVAEALASGEIDSKQAALMLYGSGVHANTFKSCCYSPIDIKKWLENAGLEVTKYIVANEYGKFIVEAVRV